MGGECRRVAQRRAREAEHAWKGKCPKPPRILLFRVLFYGEFLHTSSFVILIAALGSR